MERCREFPRRFSLTRRCVVWDLGEIEAWLAQRKRASAGAAGETVEGPDVRTRRTRPVRRSLPLAQDRPRGRLRRWAGARDPIAAPAIPPSPVLLASALPQAKQPRHSFTPRSRKALRMTLNEDRAIAAAASWGDSRSFIDGYRTPAAIGTPATL